jgi:hypothetical protein
VPILSWSARLSRRNSLHSMRRCAGLRTPSSCVVRCAYKIIIQHLLVISSPLLEQTNTLYVSSIYLSNNSMMLLVFVSNSKKYLIIWNKKGSSLLVRVLKCAVRDWFGNMACHCGVYYLRKWDMDQNKPAGQV